MTERNTDHRKSGIDSRGVERYPEDGESVVNGRIRPVPGDVPQTPDDR